MSCARSPYYPIILEDCLCGASIAESKVRFFDAHVNGIITYTMLGASVELRYRPVVVYQLCCLPVRGPRRGS